MINAGVNHAAEIEALYAEYNTAMQIVRKKSMSMNRNEYLAARKHADEIAAKIRKLKNEPGVKTKVRITPISK